MQLALRRRLLTTTVLIGASMIGSAAFAQDTQAEPAQAAEMTDTSDTIVVTGSLIQNPSLTGSSPVASIGEGEIALRQLNNAEQVLRDLPGVVPSIGAQVNNGNAGASFADLRGLGNFRNLVLLDGVRVTPGDLVGRVDLNNIPLALVQRVDTLTGGAATTYGADAVSGVINFITRQDFAGLELNVSNAITERGDGNQFRADLTIGGNFDDGRGNAVLSVGYQDVDPIYQGARRISRNNYTSTSGSLGGSGTTVPTRFAGATGSQVIDPTTGSLRPYVGSRDGFNFNPFNIFQVPFKRYNIYGAARYEIDDNLEVYTRGVFSKNTVNTIIAPSGIFNQTALIPVSNPFLPAGARSQFCAANNVAGRDANPYQPGVQGLTPAECAAAATATTTTDPNYREFTTNVARRTVELGPRISEFTTQFFDYRAGFRLKLSDSINLDVSGAYGESQNRQVQSGYLIVSRLRTALYTTSPTSCNLGSSPTVTTTSASGAPIVLAGQGAGTSAGTGCVPVNIFGPAGSISAAQIPYLTATASTQANTSLAQARALLSGDFGVSSPFAEDPIGFAVGAEYRDYKASQEADILSASAGELGGAGGAVIPFRGGYDVREVYGEVIAPLVADRPFFKSLTLEAGIRYSDYKVGGGSNAKYDTTTWKLGGSWEPVDSVKLRGNYQRAVRAPNIAELFTPTNVLLTNLSQDPCRGTRPLNDANLRAVCLLQGAPASTIGTIPNPTAAQAQSTTAGGTYLRPETSDSFTIGVVLQPDFVPGLSITLDYYRIKIKNAISQPLPDDLITGCFGDSNGSAITANSVNNPICQLFRRNPATGALDGDPATTGGLVFPSSNSGRILTDGIDLGINYRTDLGFADLNLNFQGNWTNRSKFQSIVEGSVIPPGYPGAGGPLPTTEFRECVGFYSQNCGSPGSAGPSSAAGSIQPEFSWNQRTTLSFDKVDVSVLWRHISAVQAEPGVVFFEGTIGAGALAGRRVNFGRIPAYDYFDLATRIGVNDNLDLTLTVTNLFDKDPPVVGGTIGSTAFNSGNTYPSTYDPLGRRYSISARLRF